MTDCLEQEEERKKNQTNNPSLVDTAFSPSVSSNFSTTQYIKHHNNNNNDDLNFIHEKLFERAASVCRKNSVFFFF